MNFSYSNKKLAAVVTGVVGILLAFNFLSVEAAAAITAAVGGILVAFDGHAEVPGK